MYILGAEFCCGVNSVSPAETRAEFTRFWCTDFEYVGGNTFWWAVDLLLKWRWGTSLDWYHGEEYSLTILQAFSGYRLTAVLRVHPKSSYLCPLKQQGCSWRNACSCSLCWTDTSGSCTALTCSPTSTNWSLPVHKKTWFFSSRVLLYWVVPLAQKYSEFLQDPVGCKHARTVLCQHSHTPALSLLAFVSLPPLQVPSCSWLQLAFCSVASGSH